jgi:hypothetical protein
VCQHVEALALQGLHLDASIRARLKGDTKHEARLLCLL